VHGFTYVIKIDTCHVYSDKNRKNQLSDPKVHLADFSNFKWKKYTKKKEEMEKKRM
jgi:hypothetical protein